MKKDTSFFNWLNNSIFWKNNLIMKRSYTDKRVSLCNTHKRSKKNLLVGGTTYEI